MNDVKALSDDELYRIAGISPRTTGLPQETSAPAIADMPDEELLRIAGLDSSPEISAEDVTPFGPVTDSTAPPMPTGTAEAAVNRVSADIPQPGAEQEGFLGKLFRPERQMLTGALGTLSGMAGYGQRFKVPGAERAAETLESTIQNVAVKDPAFIDKLAAGAGSMLTFMVPGMGIGKAASMLSKVPNLARWIATLTASGIEAGTEAGQVYRDMIARGSGEDAAKKAADLTGAINFALLGVTNRLGIFGDRAAGVKKALITGILEGPLQEGPQSAISSYAKGDPIDWRDVGESSAIGTIIGSGVGYLMPQDIGTRLKGPVKNMYDADIARGIEPQQALDRVSNTIAGKSQVRIAIEEIEAEQTQAAAKQAEKVTEMSDQELMDIAGAGGGELTGELLGRDAEESARAFEPLLREQEEQAAFEEELRRSPVGAEMLRQELEEREFEPRRFNLRQETPQEAAEKEVSAERETVEKVKARMIENRQAGKPPFEGLTDAEINLAQRQAQEARELTTSPDQAAHIKKVEDAKVNAIDTKTAVEMVLDGRNIADHIEKGIQEGKNPEVVRNNLRELLMTELAKDPKMLPTEKLEAEKRLNQAIADAYEGHLTRKAATIPSKIVKGVTKSNKPLGDIIEWVKKKGGIGIQAERWKGELVDLRDNLNQGKRFGRGNAVVNSTSKNTLDQLALMAHSEGLITEDTPQSLLDALAGRKRPSEAIEAGIDREMRRAQAETPQTIYPDQIAEGQKVIIKGEEYERVGVDKKGRVILKDGETIKADIFEPMEVDGILPPPKRKEGPSFSRERLPEIKEGAMTTEERAGLLERAGYPEEAKKLREKESFTLTTPEAKKPATGKPKASQVEMFPPSLEGPLTAAEEKETPIERAKAEEAARKTEIEEAQRQGRLLSTAPKHPGYGMGAEAVRNSIRKIASKWNVKGGIKVVEAIEDLPAHLANAIKSDTGTGKIEGLYDPETGGIYLIANHIRNHQRAQEVLFHEAVGHYGLRTLMGDKINPLLDKVYVFKRAEADKVAKQYELDTKGAEGRQKAAEEVLARMAERNEKSSWLDRAYAAIREWLRNIGFDLKLSDTDIRKVLADARGVLEGKKATPISFARQGVARSIKSFAGTFTTKIEQAIRSLPETFSRQQLQDTIRKASPKEDELKQINIEDFLKEKGLGKISKADVEAYVEEKKAKIVPVEFGGEKPSRLRYLQTNELILSPEEKREMLALERELNVPQGEYVKGEAKFSSYVIPGESIPGSYVEHFETVEGEKGPRPKVKQSWDFERRRHYVVGEGPASVDVHERDVEDVVNNFMNKGWQDGHPQYSDVKNPVVRWRGDGRQTADGKKTFFVSEIQPPSKENQAKMPEWAVKRWREIGIKSAIRYAAENGYDSVSLATGEQVADLYDLSKQVSKVTYMKDHGKSEYTGGELKTYGLNGKVVDSRVLENDSELEQWIGKDAATKLLKQEAIPDKDYPQRFDKRSLSGLDLKVGGEGIKKLYDQDLANTLRKYGESIGGKFGDKALTLTPALTDKVLHEGQPLYSREATEEKPISPIRARHHLVKSIDDFIGSLSTRLKNINPQLKYSLRKFEFQRMERILQDERNVKPFLQAMKRMSKADKKAFDIARMSGDRPVIETMLKKYDMAKEYNLQRFVLNGLYSRAKSVGFSLGYLQDYSPRILKDPDGFLTALMQDKEAWSAIDEAIKTQEKELGRYLEPQEKAAVANLLLRGYKVNNISLSMTGNMKRRMIDKLTEELEPFYYPADHSLLMYINDVNNTIEARRFFGKEAGVKALPLFEADRTAHIDDSVGAYVIRLLAEGKIRPEQEIELSRLLKARFNEKGVTGVVKLYKDLSYIDTLGSPISAITQIGDLAFAMYQAGIYRTGKALLKAVAGKSELTKEDIHIQDIVEEFRGGSKASKALAKVFKYTGFEKMDALGKESVINSALDKYRKQARTDKQGLARKLKDIFGSETPQVIADLADGRTTDNVKLLVFNNLLDVQPVALSEMPVKYLIGGNGRIFYMLKTYTMKQFDVMRSEAFSKIASGDKKEVLRGVRNLIHLATVLIIANAGADEIKDFVLGRKTDFKDRVIDNALRLFGISKWAVYKAREEGIFSATVKGILPPGKLIDSVYKDIVNGVDKGAESVQSIPVIGKMYYWWFGKGKYKTKKKERSLKKKRNY